jgi:hypothetical protein
MKELKKRRILRMIEIGDIVQVDPMASDTFGACLVVVTEIKSWGIQGYVQSAGVDGQQYIRLNFDQFEMTGGKSIWRIS